MSNISREQRQEFCRCFLQTLDPRSAADKAGLFDKDPISLLERHDFQKELERQRGILGLQINQEDVTRKVCQLAFATANDCVRLVMEEGANIPDLELSLLSELKRGANGVVEIKLVDKLKVLDRLLELLGGRGNENIAGLISALSAGAQQTEE